MVTALADRMIGEITLHQSQEQGTVIGVGGFSSPVSTDAAGVCPAPTSAQVSRYEGFGYKLPIVQSAIHVWNVWYDPGAYKNLPIYGGVDALLESNHGSDC